MKSIEGEFLILNLDVRGLKSVSVLVLSSVKMLYPTVRSFRSDYAYEFEPEYVLKPILSTVPPMSISEFPSPLVANREEQWLWECH